jgi:DUF1680 family protein
MNFKIPYKVENKYNFASLGDVNLGGCVGTRMDTFIYERVSGKFAINEILKEAELELEERYDDQYGPKEHCYWRSEFWGKLMLSAVRVCRLKKDEGLKEDIRKSVYRVISYQDNDGYLCTYLDKDLIVAQNKDFFNWNVWGRKYILWALVEAAMLLDDDHVLGCGVKLLDQLIKQIKEQNVRVKDTGVIDGMPASSILKPLLITYRLTGKEEYLDLAKTIVSNMDREDGERPNLIRNALSGVAPAHWYDEKDGWCAKAYEMMSCFDGFVEYYRITGEERVIEATKAFWELLVKYEANTLGNVGYNEWFYDAKKYPDASTEVCDAIHWMRLCSELYKLFGEAKYMEYFEKSFLNAFLAGVYENGKDGAFFVRSSGRHWSAMWQCTTKYQHCCLNNVARGFVNAAECGVAKGPDGFYINTYYKTRSVFGKKDFLINKGYFTNGFVRITARNMEEGEKVYIRIPSWSKNTEITLEKGDKKVAIENIVCGEYKEIVLSEGSNVISVQFDMTPRIYDFEGEFRKLDDEDYHVRRWCDPDNGLCNKDAMVTKPMSVVYKGALLLARSKRLGCTEEEMFSGKTVWGKNAKCTIKNYYHPYPAVLTADLVTFEIDGESVTYRMCDYASACNINSEDARYFNISI